MANNVNTVRINMLTQAYATISESSRTHLAIMLVANLSEAIPLYFCVQAFLLWFAKSDDPKHFECWSHPIQYWLFGQMFRYISILITMNSSFLCSQNHRQTAYWKRVRQTVNIGIFLWFLLGYVWVIQDEESYTCEKGSEAEHIWTIAYYLLIAHIVVAFLPCMMCCLMVPVMCCFMPFFLAHFRRADNRGAAPADIAEVLTTTKYESGMFPNAEDATCAICITEYEEGQDMRVLPCDPAGRHHFHKECVDAWLEVNDSCPVCREHIVSPNNNNAEDQPLLHNDQFDDDSDEFESMV